ncbi:MAG TPA: gluconate 5-dehydrogenase [Candidatus Omnitrophica bacterium]|nr:MAG: gluconate 5-dehydrogenase [Omnitrophica WOR_2 bacterium RIFCSPLOWO2_02_FULL_63_16]OGX50213.1 MAG: gluconate 5-dehydrogenase [Omnitrophica WOR_2 bacterium RIFCSPLOWO2_12_FULL_63_16]HBH97589.1 gluconate 5-dehydrogenase [Candidatus Omnitrophota bacterium]
MTLEELFRLQGKVAVVAGGTGYLGSTLVQAMVDFGMTVVTLDVHRLPPSLQAASRRGRVRHLRCDVTSQRDLQRCREAILRRHKRVDVLLNAAGTNAPTPFLRITEAEFDRILRVNLLGTLYGCQVFGEVMVQQRVGSIINFSSVSLGPPLSKAFVYSIAKAGAFNLTQNLAREWAPFHVRVNALRPGFFPTEWSHKHFIDARRRRDILRHTPMARFGHPEELIGAVLWLASDAASFVTGSLVTVDGGFTAMTI